MHNTMFHIVYSAYMEKLLIIQILGWNGEKHLRATAEALSHVPKNVVEIRYIDNGSTDTSLAIIRELLPDADILKLEKNIGFAAAHNIGISQCTTPFILTLDQDQEIIWDGIEKLLAAMQANPKLGAVQGKLYRQTDAPHPSPLLSKERGTIDSAGITQTPSFNGKERGSNEQDTGQYEEPANLLAVTGGCGLYRVEALRQVSYKRNAVIPDLIGDPGVDDPPIRRTGVDSRLRGNDNEFGEVFDEVFFAYKEDVDLGWRLNNMGWQVQYIPVLVSYHARTLGKRGVFNWGLSIQNIQERITSPRTKWSLRNYIWMIAKNASTREIIFHWPFIKSRLFVFFILSLFSKDLFSVWKETWVGLKGMREKGRSTRKLPPPN